MTKTKKMKAEIKAWIVIGDKRWDLKAMHNIYFEKKLAKKVAESNRMFVIPVIILAPRKEKNG